MDTFTVQFFQRNDPEPTKVLVRQALSLSVEVIALLRFDAAETATTCREVQARANSSGRSIVEQACLFDSHPLSLGIVAAILISAIPQWSEGSIEGEWATTMDLLQFCWGAKGTNDDSQTKLMARLLGAMAPLAKIRAATPTDDSIFGEVGESLFALAEHLAHLEEVHLAFNIALSAGSFYFHNRALEAGDRSASLALLMAQQIENKELIAAALFQLATNAMARSEDDPAWQKPAFDAIERVLRYWAAVPEASRSGLNFLWGWLRDKRGFESLGPLLISMQKVEDRAPMTGDAAANVQAVIRAASPLWDVPFEELIRRVIDTLSWAEWIEESRLAFQPLVRPTVAATSWNGISLEHPAFIRAIPQGDSLLNEELLDDILLVLIHETAHVFCLLGTVGFASWTQRMAIFELEARLCRADLREQVKSKCPVSLPLDSDMESLAVDLGRIEQELEVERKLQLFERAWGPWLEGVAVFGELHANPQDAPAVYSEVFGLIVNLFDRDLRKEVRENGITIQEAVRRNFERIWNLIADAKERVGNARLRGYLDASYQKYLAGYCAVRSVVSAWRATLDENLCGAQAFRLLLDATRRSSFEMTPQPDLPIEEYCSELVRLQLAWLHEISSVPAEDLRSLIITDPDHAPSGGTHVWSNGRIKSTPAEGVGAIEREFPRQLLSRISKAKLSRAGSRADQSRVASPSEVVQFVMAEVARALEESVETASIVDERLMNEIFWAMMVVPIGTVECPFWLNQRDRRLACLIRTTERNRSEGKPSYIGISVPLTDQSFMALRQKVSHGATGRLKLSRVALLLPENWSTSAVAGTNFLTFQIEDWLHVENAGLRLGVEGMPQSVTRAIESRLLPDEISGMMNALTDSGNPCARRSLTWLQTLDWKCWSGGTEFDLRSWAKHVERLAQEILDSAGQADALPVSRALFEFVFGKGTLTENLTSEGLEILRNQGKIGSLIDILMETGRGCSTANVELCELIANDLATMGFPFFDRQSAGWDFIRPAFQRIADGVSS